VKKYRIKIPWMIIFYSEDIIKISMIYNGFLWANNFMRLSAYEKLIKNHWFKIKKYQKGV
jgi:hypothetical protein